MQGERCVQAGLFSLCSLVGSICAGQSVGPGAVVVAGESAMGVGGGLSWTLGQPACATYLGGGHVITAGVQQPDELLLSLNVKALLDGPYSPADGLMHDDLRVHGLIPLSEPYAAMGHPAVGAQVVSAIPPSALLQTGADAIVDWVFLELRGTVDPATIIAARSALLQRDGDVVEVDGISPVRIHAPADAYHLAVLHRNHLPVMTLAAVPITAGSNVLDLTIGDVPLHVANAQVIRGTKRLLWCGDVNGDGMVKYTGSGNDRDPILIQIGSTTPNNSIPGYLPADVNLDGAVKYTGGGNDRDPLLQTIGGTTPNNTRSQPLP